MRKSITIDLVKRTILINSSITALYRIPGYNESYLVVQNKCNNVIFSNGSYVDDEPRITVAELLKSRILSKVTKPFKI